MENIDWKIILKWLAGLGFFGFFWRLIQQVITAKTVQGSLEAQLSAFKEENLTFAISKSGILIFCG